MWISTRALGSEPHHLKRFCDFSLALFRAANLVDVQPFSNRLTDGCARIKARERVLEDDLRLASIRLELRAFQPSDVRALKQD